MARQRVVGGAEEELAVEALLVADRTFVEAQEAVGGPADEVIERGCGAQLADELVAALAWTSSSEPSIVPGQVGDEVLAYSAVSRRHLGVVTDAEALRSRPSPRRTSFTSQVAGDLVIAAGARQRDLGLLPTRRGRVSQTM